MSGSAELGDRLEDVVLSLVRNGRYPSRGDVLRAGVRLVEEREKRLAAMDAALTRGLADADAGRVKAAGAVAERLSAKYAAMVDERGE